MICSVSKDYKMLNDGADVNYSDSPDNLLITSFPNSNHQWKARSKDHSKKSVANITAFCIGI